MSDKPKERKSGWYVVEFSDGTQGILPCENGIVDTIATVQPKIADEREVFSHLKQADEMRELLKELSELENYISLNEIEDAPIIQRLINKAKQFI